jgi:antirestriction protein ArdC
MEIHMHRDLYQEVTDRIVTAIEAGTLPWVKPWSVASEPRPINASTLRPYRGINCILLGLEAQLQGYARSRWLTYRQANELGACVRKGARGTTIVFYKPLQVPADKGAGTEPVETRVIPLLRAFVVFNVEQVEGLPGELTSDAGSPSWEAHAEAEALVGRSGAAVKHGTAAAYYSPSSDSVYLPDRHAFADQAAYYPTLLHELVHWTGHPARCARDLVGRFGDAAYAMEELVAELGSAFLCAHCHIDGRLQHASYVASWLKVLKNDKRAIFTASTKAQAAADFLLRIERPAIAEAIREAA